ncbi:MAG: hypothetical protein HY459_03875 [Parcubacteria group bacterium]|nr:hypothetical protein [Parcubacteria group bacterium]
MVPLTILGISLVIDGVIGLAATLRFASRLKTRNDPVARWFFYFFSFFTTYLLITGLGHLTDQAVVSGWGFIVGSVFLWLALASLATAAMQVGFPKLLAHGRVVFVLVITLGLLTSIASFTVFADSLAHVAESIVYYDKNVMLMVNGLTSIVFIVTSAIFLHHFLIEHETKERLASLFIVLGLWFLNIAWVLRSVITESASFLAISTISIIGLFALFVGSFAFLLTPRAKT